MGSLHRSTASSGLRIEYALIAGAREIAPGNCCCELEPGIELVAFVKRVRAIL